MCTSANTCARLNGCNSVNSRQLSARLLLGSRSEEINVREREQKKRQIQRSTPSECIVSTTTATETTTVRTVDRKYRLQWVAVNVRDPRWQLENAILSSFRTAWRFRPLLSFSVDDRSLLQSRIGGHPGCHITPVICVIANELLQTGVFEYRISSTCDQKLAFERQTCNRDIAQRREKQRLSGASR